jgi:ribonuclease J
MLRFSQDFRKKADHPLQTWPRENKPAVFTAGPFRITASNVDHSAFDAYSLLIEVDGRRIFYSGDFRGHGRKAGLTDKLLKEPPTGIDVMIMEGTSLPVEGKAAAVPPLTEADLEKQFVELFRRTPGRVFVSWSAGNIDRTVTLFRACLQTDRILVIDLYTALVLEEMGRFASGLPVLRRETKILVVVTQKLNAWLMKLGFENPARHFMKAKVAIPARALEENPGRLVVMARNGLARSGYAGKVHPTAADVWVWSQWSGYLKDEAQTMDLKNFLAPCGEPLLIHSSGHAPPELLARLAKAVNPRILLPIHGEAWPRHQADFENLRILENGQWLEI